ncbi:MAG: NgoFVII family restriction endonuclease [Thermoflexales bacterium]|nr:NgoFVII family restriction endonuclease [Thermoflexales bacterium]
MPRIFDNIQEPFLPAFNRTLETAYRADFCVGYFNLRGWSAVADRVDTFIGGDGQRCRLIVGMSQSPHDELRQQLRVLEAETMVDKATAARLKARLAAQFREQLSFGAPSGPDQAALKRLVGHLKAGKLAVKLFVRHPLHAKLYLFHRHDFTTPVTGFVGSSNLTAAGLSKQGELNVDVVDQDATQKLAAWFEGRWNDAACIDISEELIRILDESWAIREPTPYEIYIKIAYHLSQEARAGLTQFEIPHEMRGELFEFQKAAVKIAAHHLHKRGGVLIGDVVGLGKTLMATTVARIFEDDLGVETLILCPKNLERMWKDYAERYGLHGKVQPITRAISELPSLRRYRLVIVDESHNLRNREGKRYKAIRDYIEKNDSRCILLSATPYNKTYLDLSNQLRLFVPEDKSLGVRPERFLRELDAGDAPYELQAGRDTLAAFEKSEYADDWRELMRLYMVRRTRGFIQQNYAQTDPESQRKYLIFPATGERSYFPSRVPRTVKFKIDEGDPNDQYARLYDEAVVAAVGALSLPRYGLGNFVLDKPAQPPTPDEKRILGDLSRGGKRLMGFCRINLFKRLESSGQAFLLSVERHILRNYVFLHALAEGKPLPIGTQDIGLLDPRNYDEDPDDANAPGVVFDVDDTQDDDDAVPTTPSAVGHPLMLSEAAFAARAAAVYQTYAEAGRRRFRWIRPTLFRQDLANALKADADVLLGILRRSGEWQPDDDRKLDALARLVQRKHPGQKILVFSQFADTVDYLAAQLDARGIAGVEGVTGDNADPTAAAWRFSPVSSGRREHVKAADETRVLIATDVLSEGQNLQDAHIVVNYDLPWAIIRLIQRAGRVDRIGQQAAQIDCYTFLPAEGVERLIRLRERLMNRLRENAEVVGTDEAFFEDDDSARVAQNLYNEQAGILDGDVDTEVDLASYAWQIWKNAIDADPTLEATVAALAPMSFSTRSLAGVVPPPGAAPQPGVLAYVRTAEGNDALAWLNASGEAVTDSQLAILNAAACPPETRTEPLREDHHELVRAAIQRIADAERNTAGELGRASGARYKTYHRLKRHLDTLRGTLFEAPLARALEDIYRFPLRQTAADTLNRQLKAGVADDVLAGMVANLREEGRLCVIEADEAGDASREPRIICSLGLRQP